MRAVADKRSEDVPSSDVRPCLQVKFYTQQGNWDLVSLSTLCWPESYSDALIMDHHTLLHMKPYIKLLVLLQVGNNIPV